MKQFVFYILVIFSLPAGALELSFNQEQESLKHLRDLESQGNYEQAYFVGMNLFNSIYSKVRVEEVIAETESKLTKIWDEKIVAKMQGSLDLIILKFKFSHDITKRVFKY
ncbi:MAG: hypothetical protein SGJ18_13755 [Pseudomonadota bacterium]|nr:hypothetical protein [Pseudomonadota bacterium]